MSNFERFLELRLALKIVRAAPIERPKGVKKLKKQLIIALRNVGAGIGIAAVVFVGTAVVLGVDRSTQLPGGAISVALLYGFSSRMKWRLAGIPAIIGVCLFYGIAGLVLGN